MAMRRSFASTLMVPVAFAGSMLLPAHTQLHWGIGGASACSGGAPGVPGAAAPREAGFTWLKPSLAFHPGSPAAPVPVATDGFFVIDAEGSMLSVDDAAAGMQVVVSDASGATLEGETKLLLEKGDGWYLFGWSAKSPLPAGAQLTATLSGAPITSGALGNVGGQFPLTVVGEPTALPEPSFAFSRWVDFYHLPADEQWLTCQSTICGVAQTLRVPATLEKRVGVELTWQPPPVVGGVAWALRVEPSTTNPDVNVNGAYAGDYLGDAPASSAVSLGRALFPTEAARYCVTLVLKDLRTGEEKRSEVCAEPEPATLAETDSSLGQCDEPPPALRDPWCALKAGTDKDCNVDPGGIATDPVDNLAGSGGSQGGGPATNPVDRGGSESTPPVDDARPNAASPRTSKGCAIGSTSRAEGAGWLFAALAIAAGLRARAASRRTSL